MNTKIFIFFYLFYLGYFLLYKRLIKILKLNIRIEFLIYSFTLSINI